MTTSSAAYYLSRAVGPKWQSRFEELGAVGPWFEAMCVRNGWRVPDSQRYTDALYLEWATPERAVAVRLCRFAVEMQLAADNAVECASFPLANLQRPEIERRMRAAMESLFGGPQPQV